MKVFVVEVRESYNNTVIGIYDSYDQALVRAKESIIWHKLSDIDMKNTKDWTRADSIEMVSLWQDGTTDVSITRWNINTPKINAQ